MNNKKIVFSLSILIILLCECQQSHIQSDENNDTIIDIECSHQMQYETRYVNLVEKDPKLQTYPTTPRDIHCQLIEMIDNDKLYDAEFYDSVYLERKKNTVERHQYYDMLAISMLMANKRQYPKAYYDVYVILNELFILDAEEKVSNDVIDLCMFYLIRSAQLGYEPACQLTGIYNDSTKYDHKRLFYKIHRR